MLKYDTYPLNAWVYGLSFLTILILPLVWILFYLENMEGIGNLLEPYLFVMLFPYAISSEFVFQIPYLGALLAIASFVVHLHVYSVIIERIVTFLRKN